MKKKALFNWLLALVAALSLAADARAAEAAEAPGPAGRGITVYLSPT